MKKQNIFFKSYKNLKVLVTGSTGFKGSWLSFWLKKLGAKVIGVGLKPEKDNVLFEKLNLKKKINQHYLNILDYQKLFDVIKLEKPDIVFHLAAQSIVSESYKNPVKTIKTNVIGSMNILELMRLNFFNRLIYVTSDKCYLNLNLKKNYNESDKLGGFDNYSSSKACAEILFHSYNSSFFKLKKNNCSFSARAGNVIGGGDFKPDRIIPDFFRSIQQKKKLILRNPNSTRPWQHVLEPLSGYLLLGYLALENNFKNSIYPSWNFGPNPKNCKTVIEIINMFYESVNVKKNIKIQKSNSLIETNLLSLNIDKAKNELNWSPRLSLRETIKYTSDWYSSYFQDQDLDKLTNSQIENFLES